jgi:uncharacterized protein (TIGR03435 family)
MNARTVILTGMTARLAGALFSAFLWVLASLGGSYAETNTGPRFDVASIKPSAPAARNTSIFFPPGGRLEVVNMSLKEMIANAYNIQPFQISGGPGWLDSAHYDISAKAQAARKQDDVLVRLQSLLTERFHVTFRHETHEGPVYALVMARKDRKPGPQLLPAREGGCTRFDPANAFAVDSLKLCGNFELGPDGLTLVSAPIASLTPRLARLLGRPVVDQTGLTESFNIHITWSPDQFFAMQLPPNGQPQDPTGPSIFTVFREQLGIELKSQRGPVEIFVVEHAEKPSEN